MGLHCRQWGCIAVQQHCIAARSRTLCTRRFWLHQCAQQQPKWQSRHLCSSADMLGVCVCAVSWESVESFFLRESASSEVVRIRAGFFGVCWAGARACGLRARVGAVFAVAGCVVMVEVLVVSCGLGYRAVVLCSRCAWLARRCAPEGVCSGRSCAQWWGRARACLRHRGCVRCSCAGGRPRMHLPSLRLWGFYKQKNKLETIT